MQGNDWYYVGGAAIGGMLLGSLGQRLFKSQSVAGQVLVVGRDYKRVIGDKSVLEVSITADFDKGGYTIILEENEIETQDLPEVFETPEQAADYIDKILDTLGFNPDSDWLTYLEMNLEPEDMVKSPKSMKTIY